MQFKDNQGLHVDCIMNSWFSSLPKPPRNIKTPSLAFLALNTVPLVQCLTQNKYSIDSCWTNEYISVTDSWILNFSLEFFNHSFINPFICSKNMYQDCVLEFCMSEKRWIKLSLASSHSEYRKGVKTLYQSVIGTITLRNKTNLKLSGLKWQQFIFTQISEGWLGGVCWFGLAWLGLSPNYGLRTDLLSYLSPYMDQWARQGILLSWQWQKHKETASLRKPWLISWLPVPH